MADDARKKELAQRAIEARLPPGIRIAFDDVFPRLVGRGADKANLRKVALLEKAAPVLSKALGPEETVRFAGFGTVNYTWELFFAGFWAQLINRTVLVATQARVLFIRADGKGRPESYVNELPVASIRRVRKSLFGSLILIAAS